MIIKNCEIWFAKVDPKRPNPKFDPKNPTWEVQMRTSDKAVLKYWKECDLKEPKAVIPDEGEPYFRINLKKKSIRKDGDPADPVQVVNMQREPVDPNSIGNGSIANIRVFQYPYPDKATGEERISSILMGIQLIKHIVWIPKPGEDFEDEGETEVIMPETDEDDEAPWEDEEGPDDGPKEPKKTPTPAIKVGSKDDVDPEF